MPRQEPQIQGLAAAVLATEVVVAQAAPVSSSFAILLALRALRLLLQQAAQLQTLLLTAPTTNFTPLLPATRLP
jgi:hypothetical protein